MNKKSALFLYLKGVNFILPHLRSVLTNMLLYQHMPLRLSFDVCKEMFQELAKQIFKPTVKNGHCNE